MKRFIFICVALVALLATNASGTNYQPTDQLQTHYVMQQPDAQFTAVVAQPVTAIRVHTFDVGETFKPDAWAWIDPGRNLYCNPIQTKASITPINKSDQVPNQNNAVAVSNYNTNYSYGLRC